MVEISTAEQNKAKRMKRSENSFKDIWNNFKHANIQITGVLEKRKKENFPGLKNIWRDHSWELP